MKVVINFAPIDAKDSKPVYIEGENTSNAANVRLVHQMRREYLQGLLALQKAIQAKYLPLVTEGDEDEDDLFDVEDELFFLDNPEPKELRGLYYT